jgi:hypothetical protein
LFHHIIARLADEVDVELCTESLSHKVSLWQGLDNYGLRLSTSTEQEQMNNQSPASRDTSAYCNGGLPFIYLFLRAII